MDETSLRPIVLSNAPPCVGSGSLLHYEHQHLTVAGWTFVDVRKIVGLNEDQWFSAIETWHRDLSERATCLSKWWPLLPGARLVLWRSVTTFELKPVLFALAVIEFCRCQPNGAVWIVGAPDEVMEYLREWADLRKSALIRRTETQVTRWSGNRSLAILHFWGQLARQFASIARHCAFRKRVQIKAAKVIVNSLVLNPELLRTKGDHFFGHMIDRVDGLTDQNTIWIYLDARLADRKTRSEMAAIKRRAYFMPDFFRWSDLFFALQTACNIRRALKPLYASCAPLQAGELTSPSFSANFLSSLVMQSPPLFELVLYKQWERILEESGAETIVYPYEEKPLEHAMLLAVKARTPKVRTIGFAHAAYSKGHLYLRRGRRGEPPRPDIVAVTGAIARGLFEKVGVPSEQIVVIGSPRSYRAKSCKRSIESECRTRILLLVGYGFELGVFASMVADRPEIFAGYDLVIRRYPYAWKDQQDAAEIRLRTAGVIYRNETGDLLRQIDESDIVLFESTSAAMEASLRGKLILRLNLSDIVSTNHFYGICSQDGIKYCRDADELKEQLDHIASLTPDQYAKVVEGQRRLVADLYSPIDYSQLSAMLDSGQTDFSFRYSTSMSIRSKRKG